MLMGKARREQHPHAAPGRATIPWPLVLRAVVLGGSVALLVITTLIPSESAISDGTYAPIVAGWCALLVLWFAAAWLAGQATFVLGWTEIAGAALVGWHSLAALAWLGHTNGRQTLNALWLVIGYGITALVLRQCLRSAVHVRGLFAVMIWLATLLASFGLYQYGYSMPKLRKEYEANPDKFLVESGYSTEKESPQRTLLENRLRSVEPLATFALTNSLAGFLAPWLIATLAIALAMFGQPDKRTLLGLAIISVVLAGCLVLTKSRTAYLAMIAGVLLLALYGRGKKSWQLDWRIPTIGVGILVVIGLVAVYFGGLDSKVLSEAPKSVLYRLEYWRATAALIADHPLLGCGPGNFQQAYAHYKLPQASEMVADPHNFLLEIWATAGTPALVLLMLLAAALVCDLMTAHAASEPLQSDDLLNPQLTQRILFGGAVIGLLGSMPVAMMIGYPLESVARELPLLPAVWVLALPLWITCWWLLGPWVSDGRLTLQATVIPILVLLINLLAAGAVVFSGVIQTALVLVPAALWLSQYRTELGNASVSQRTKLVADSSRTGAGLATLAAMLLLVACLRTEYQPVLNARLKLADALYSLVAGDQVAAERAVLSAAEVDSLSPEPWRMLAEIRLSRWHATRDKRDWLAFNETAEEYRLRDPQNHLAWYSRGNWFLATWRRRLEPADLTTAIAAYRRAIDCYPNRALYHGQLAWALHLAREEYQARQEAQRAKKLDDLMPHQEQKLAHQQIFDPELGATEGGGQKRSAEQMVGELRSSGQENSP
jgi:O-antigen ligase